MKPPYPFTLVQTPAPSQHPDERLSQALKAAWQAGHDDAERLHYTSGWRAGLGHGALAGVFIGAGAVYLLVQLGRHVGPYLTTVLGH